MTRTLVTNTILRQDSGERDLSSQKLVMLDLQSQQQLRSTSASLPAKPIMLQFLGQLVYTSFPKIGFRHFSSAHIPKEIQHAFVHQVVYLRWNSYNPPAADYRAAYLYQIDTHHTLFGWLYGDGTDDVGRNVPYFVGYYLNEPLSAEHLDGIFICLQRGPLALVNQQDLGDGVLEHVSIADVHGYSPARKGVDIPEDIRNYSRTFLQMQELLNIFVPVSDRHSRPVLPPENGESVPAQSLSPQQDPLAPESQLSIPTEPTLLVQQPLAQGTLHRSLSQILQELIAKPIGIQGAFLVSLEGQPITSPIGISENSALILAGTMLYVARSTHEELQWQGIEKISVQAQEGYVILAHCTPDVFLFVKAAKALSGLLDGEINRTVKCLRTALQVPEIIDKDTELPPDVRNELITQFNLDKPIAHLSGDETAQQKMRYRGNSIH
ncbi:MAG: hypothetical protein HC851_14695 [Acaryochloris sp. RU_4_1]|nr:hypothetical protein [Acaryochloris sp. RU_4_1]NJR55574.1 hypothetical protein [Acaryochloris sp. CRU_2_0]